MGCLRVGWNGSELLHVDKAVVLTDGEDKTPLNAVLGQEGAESGRGKAQFLPAFSGDLDAAGLSLVIAQVLGLAQSQAEIEMFFAVAHGVFYCPGLAATLGKWE